MKQKTNTLISRAAAMLLMVMLTTATAWAGEYTATYQAKINHINSGLYNIILERSGNSSLKATIADKSSAWQGNTGVCVNDEYDITFKPSQNLYVATNPGTYTATGFTMSSGTTITASVASNSSYYIKQVRLLDNGIQKATSAAMAPNSRSATVTASGDIQFNYIEVTLTNDYYGTITPEDCLTVGTAASLTYNNTNYYKSGTTITMNAPANRAIDAATGVSGASIAANKRSYTFAMPKQNVTPGATMSEVHTISCPSGLTVTSSPYYTDNTTKYYKKGETYTLTVDDANKVIQSFNASGASGSSVANDKKSATVTIGTSNVTVSATLQTISGTTTDDGLSWSLAQDGSGNYTRLTVSGSGAMKTYGHTTDGTTNTWRTNAPWGWHLTSATVGDGVTSIGTQAFIGCQSLATVTLGSSVTTIGNNAFDHCDALTQITLPASVTTLNDEAFKNCSGLERIDIGHDGAVSLGSNVFQNCGNLQYIVFPSPAAVQANTSGNWSGLAEKLRAKFGHKHFGVTKDATNTAVYAIATDDDLRNLAAAVNDGNDGSNKTFLQTADIDLGGSSNPFTPIGYGRYFYGTYDGGSHTVSRLYIYAGNDNDISLFGGVRYGTVRNVILDSPSVTNTYNQDYDIRVGALIGYTEGATVENCLVVSPTVNATGNYGTKYIGALIGQTGNSTRVTNCSFYAGTGNATNGIGRRMDSTIGDVSRAYQVTLGSNVGLPNPPATGGFIAQGSHYYAQGATAQLSYTGSIPNGSRPVFTVSPDNTGATVTQQVVLTMGSADITITAKLSSTPLININTGTIADIPDQDYTGSAIVPDITLTVGGRKLTEGTDYLVSCTNNVNLGTATLTATGMGDYTGTLTKNFRICYTDKTGSCGTNVTYTLHDEDQDGHYEQLTISGTGAMTDYASKDDVPWAAKCYDINSVTVQSGVTSIGARAFYDCKYLTSVSLPEGLTSIGDYAFKYCRRLSALTVPASVESVGIEAFTCLADVTSGGTLTFASGSRLTSVGLDPFYYAKASVDMSACTSLTSVPNAFWYFDGNVTFPRSLTSIAEHCFGDCKSTTKVYIHVPDNYLLTVNNESVSATDGKADITSNIGVGTDHPAVTLSCIPNPADFVDNGDGSYTIHTATGWNIFCDILNDYPKGYFTGMTVRLGDNITVSRMAGSSNHDFTGTFDGNKNTLTVNYGTAGSPITENYAAPFRNVTTTKADPNDAADTPAAIRNLKVKGSIYTSAKYAAGIVANQYGTVNISNCRVSVRIHSSHSGDGTHGGLVAIQHNALTVEGCLFEGRLLTTNATTDCGGLVGYHSGGTCTISNCLYEPIVFSTSESYINSGATFCRNYDGTPVNCYYTATLGDAQGKAPRSITAGANVTISNIALTGSSQNYDVSGIRAYDNGGIKYNSTLYYGSGDQVSLTLGNLPGGYQYNYTASAGTLSGSDNPYTLTMPNEDVVVSVRCAPDPTHFAVNADGTEYTIKTATGWNVFCDALDDNATYHRFSGKTVKLASDIPTAGEKAAGTTAVTRMAGKSSHEFCGTFDGDGHTLTVNIDSDSDHDYTAPFSYVSNENDSPAAIRNLKVTGTVESTHKYAGGLIGGCWRVVDIENCLVSTVIDSQVNGEGSHGGIIGRQDNGTLTIRGCAFDGQLLGSTTTHCAGFVGYINGGTLNISNSLFAPAEVTVSPTESATFALGTTSTVSNCYYTTPPSGGWGASAQGKAAHSIEAGEGVTLGHAGAATTYSVSGITAYKASDAHGDNDPFIAGLVYNNVLYAGSGDEVSLTLASSGYQSSGFLASAGTLSGSDNPYTLTMPNEDVTVSVSSLVVIDWAEVNEGTETDPYIIYNKDQLDLLANRVNGINGETRQDNGYQNKYFELGADITYSHSADANLAEYESNYTAIGGYFDSRYRSFKGHFDGKGHTISGIRIYKGGKSDSDQYQGLFSETDHATIRGIILADVRITGYDHTGGIVGYNGNFSSVSDCHVAADVAIHAVQSDAYHHGGIVGTNSAYCTVSDCTSAATLTTTSGSVRNYSGIAGSNSGTLRHNLAIGAVVPATKNNSYGAICGNGGGTLENNYYHACRVASDDVTATNVGCGNISDGNGGYTTDDVTANDGAVPTLRDDADNSTALGLLAALATAGPNGTPLDLGWGAGKYPMQLAGRTLYKDGNWNTLVLPFAIDDFDGTPLEGATVKELNATTSNLNNGTLTLNFSDNLTAIEAGTPYIVKWTKPDGYDEADPETRDVKNPVFTGVTVSSTTPTPVTSNDNSVTFVGQYSPFAIDDSNINSVIMLGAKNTLGYSKNPRQLHSFRAHFEVPTSANVREIVLDFGDETTGISLTPDPSPRGEGSEYYTLDGRKLDGKPTKKGMYIVNGRKVVIK